MSYYNNNKTDFREEVYHTWFDLKYLRIIRNKINQLKEQR